MSASVGRSLRFSDAERALLARKAFGIPRKALLELGTIVAPDTRLRWHRMLVIGEARTAVIRLPPRLPNLNAYAERFVRSIKDKCLDRMILVGEASLRRAIDEFIVHYHSERNHQGLGNELIREPDRDGTADRPVRRRQRLGGMLSLYHRAAA